MLWLVIIWALYFDLLLPRRRRRMHERQLFGPRLCPPEELVVVGFAVFVVLEIVLTAVHYSGLGSAVTEAKSFTFLVVGYFLLRGICCHAGRKETLDFVAAIVVVNTIAAGLFVLHQGLHIHIYNATEYQSIIFQGQRLTRSFYFMPQLLPLAIAYCVAKRKWGVFWFGVFVVTLAAVWVSYTRSLLLIAVIEVVVVLAVRLFKAREAWPALKRGLQIVGVVIVLGLVAFAVLPTQSNYILSRLHLATAKGGPVHDTNVQSRIDSFRTAYGYTGGNELTGAGFVSAVQDPRVSTVDSLASDLVWVPTVYRLGLVGVVAGRPAVRHGGVARRPPEPQRRRRRRVPHAHPVRHDRRGVPAGVRVVDDPRPGAQPRWPCGSWRVLTAETCRRRSSRPPGGGRRARRHVRP